MDINDCIIPELWCGNSQNPPNNRGKRYTRKGSSFECMKKGFGAGMYSERAKHIPEGSLMQLKYIGETYQEKFNQRGIHNITEFENSMRQASRELKRNVLTFVCTKINGVVDLKAYNSLIMHLYNRGIGNLPACIRI